MNSHHKPFSRFQAIMGAVAAMMAGGATAGTGAMSMSRQQALSLVLPGGYQSRGKGEGHPGNKRRGVGTARHQRSARKLVNVRRNRAAHRG